MRSAGHFMPWYPGDPAIGPVLSTDVTVFCGSLCPACLPSSPLPHVQDTKGALWDTLGCWREVLAPRDMLV